MARPALPSLPFGAAAEDLDFDFASADRPALVTALLARCTRPADEDHWWQRAVGDRTAALLDVLHASTGSTAIALTLRCAACSKRFEIELPHAAIVAARAAPESVELQRADGDTPLTLRRATGNDLRAWHDEASGGGEADALSMLARLCTRGAPEACDVAPAAAALAAADPLVAFMAACACPECGADAEIDVDLEALALQRLAARQQQLLREVHALASRYGWTEREILAVAPARRARYLELIDGWAG